ncbi:MAG: cytochrome c [Verrucomicrobia bacterium]|nr:cytochrome c [Verrucomicrobiota bacterium]
MSDETKQSSCTAPEAEPAVTHTTLPIWLVAAFLILLFTSAWTFNERGGWFDAKVNQPFTSVGHVMAYQPRMNENPQIRLGKAVFTKACENCHDASGMGRQGTAPPLAGSDWVNAPKPDRIIRIPLYGLSGPITVSGKQYSFNLAMMELGSALSEQEVANVLTYIRQAWGNKAGPVSVEQVQAVKKEIGKRPNFTPEELQKVADR